MNTLSTSFQSTHEYFFDWDPVLKSSLHCTSKEYTWMAVQVVVASWRQCGGCRCWCCRVATQVHQIQEIVARAQLPCWADWCDGMRLMNDWKFLHFYRLFYHSYRDWETNQHHLAHYRASTSLCDKSAGNDRPPLVQLTRRKSLQTLDIISLSLSLSLSRQAGCSKFSRLANCDWNWCFIVCIAGFVLTISLL